MANSTWLPSDIGNPDMKDLLIKSGESDKILFRLITKTSSDDIYAFVDDAKQRGGIKIPYDSNKNETKFAVNAMEKTSALIYDEIRAMKRNKTLAENVNPTLRDNADSICDIIPMYLIVTGDEREIVIDYVAKTERQ